MPPPPSPRPHNFPEATREGELRVLLVSQFPVFVAVGALIPVLPLPPGARKTLSRRP